MAPRDLNRRPHAGLDVREPGFGHVYFKARRAFAFNDENRESGCGHIARAAQALGDPSVDRRRKHDIPALILRLRQKRLGFLQSARRCVSLQIGLSKVLLGNEAVLVEPRVLLGIDRRVAACSARSKNLSLCRAHRRFYLGVVKPHQRFALFDGITLLNRDFADIGRNTGGNFDALVGRNTAGHLVSARKSVERLDESDLVHFGGLFRCAQHGRGLCRFVRSVAPEERCGTDGRRSEKECPSDTCHETPASMPDAAGPAGGRNDKLLKNHAKQRAKCSETDLAGAGFA